MKLGIATLCVLAVLAGCQKEASTTVVGGRAAKGHARPAAQSGPTPEEMTSGMVEAVTQGKSHAPVVVKFDLPQRPIEGQPARVAVAVLPQVAADAASVEVSASDGMQVAAQDGQFEFAAVDPTQVYRHDIQVTPSAPGLYLLTLNVTLKHDQMVDSRVVSVPIIVDDSAAAPTAPASAAAPHRGS